MVGKGVMEDLNVIWKGRESFFEEVMFELSFEGY